MGGAEVMGINFAIVYLVGLILYLMAGLPLPTDLGSARAAPFWRQVLWSLA
jgi:hypothetical protein